MLEKINGREPKIAMLNHDNEVNKKLAANLVFYHDQNLIKKIIYKK